MAHKYRQILEAALLKTGKVTSHPSTENGKAQVRYWLNHTEALTHPRKFEAPLLAMIRGLADYADCHETQYGDSIANDHYTGDIWETMARGWKGLLTCEHNRLDGGVLDGAIRELATAIGFDGDKL